MHILFFLLPVQALFNWPETPIITPLQSDQIVAVRDQHYYDTYGRQRFFRGMNAVYKGFPYYPVVDRFDPALSFAKEDVQLLSDLNMNIIRLGVEWVGVESVRGVYNQTYVDVLKGIVEMCAEKGIYVLLDFHQDVSIMT
jgi:endoglycosylceramidase